MSLYFLAGIIVQLHWKTPKKTLERLIAHNYFWATNDFSWSSYKKKSSFRKRHDTQHNFEYNTNENHDKN